MNCSTQSPILPSNCVNNKERESLRWEYLFKGLFTWSAGPRSSGVGFFCFHALGDTKQKKLTPLDRGPPLHVNRVQSTKFLLHQFATSKANRWLNTFREKTGIRSSNCMKYFEDSLTYIKRPPSGYRQVAAQ